MVSRARRIGLERGLVRIVLDDEMARRLNADPLHLTLLVSSKRAYLKIPKNIATVDVALLKDSITQVIGNDDVTSPAAKTSSVPTGQMTMPMPLPMRTCP